MFLVAIAINKRADRKWEESKSSSLKSSREVASIHCPSFSLVGGHIRARCHSEGEHIHLLGGYDVELMNIQLQIRLLVDLGACVSSTGRCTKFLAHRSNALCNPRNDATAILLRSTASRRGCTAINSHGIRDGRALCKRKQHAAECSTGRWWRRSIWWIRS